MMVAIKMLMVIRTLDGVLRRMPIATVLGENFVKNV